MDLNHTIQITGWAGNICFFIGALLTAKKCKSLFIWQVLGNVFYILQARVLTNTPLLVLSIVLAIVNVVGWLLWTKKEHNDLQKL